MKINDTDLILLSSYLDDELTQIEKNLVEEKLQQSAELRIELEKLRAVKSEVASIPPLQPDPFFDTRLIASLETQQSPWKKFLSFKKPIFAFASLTVLIALFFKLEPTLLSDFYENKKSELMEFYTSNLKPYLITSNLSNEDIFNFAFNRFLPLNEDKSKILSLEHDSEGNEIAEIKYAGVADGIFDMNSFVKTFSLNEKEKKKVDSVLLAYNDKISSKILVNENNTFALNKDIWTYQNLLKAELLDIARNADERVFASIVTEPQAEELNSSLIKLRSLGENKNNVYVCINPDTVFSVELDINEDEMKSEIKLAYSEAKKELHKANKELEKANRVLNENFKVFVKTDKKFNPNSPPAPKDVVVYSDSQSFKIKIPGMNYSFHTNKRDNLEAVKWVDFAIGQLKEFDIEMKIDSLNSKNSFSFSISSDKKTPNRAVTVGTGNKSDSRSDSKNENVYFNFDEETSPDGEYKSINLDSLLRNFNFKVKDDSLVIENFRSAEIDSFWKFLPKEFKEEMKVLKKELDQLRNEMNTWKKELPSHSKKNPKNP